MTKVSATKFTLIAAAAALFLGGSPGFAQNADGASEPARDAKGKITDKDHPDYVKCRTESVIGSRAKKRKVCLTNRQWAEVSRDGVGVANELVEGSRAGMNGSN